METLDLLEVRFIGAFICALLVSMILLSMIIFLCQVVSALLDYLKRIPGVKCKILSEF